MAFIDVPMRTVRMHGPLIKRFGKEFKYKALDAKKAIDAMRCLLPGFEKYMIEAHKKGLTFAIFVGGKNISKDELDMTKGTDDIHILPVIIGSKRGGLFQTILGVALIAAATIATSGFAGGLAAAGWWGTTAMVGASMALGGVVQMLSPQMPGLRMRESPDNKPSYAFGGPVNTTAQGNPVPVLYGTREIGGAIISAGIYTEDQQ
ncbi:tail assembly protein [Photorhabdus luminescens]|uniref:Phage tail protein n=1 Tax=Photorhabdus luminescens subsp. mexicana TaxID=2100167 RepID=A0A4R4J3K1_PHOLU|nr:tail assembly protein [Photorhabdus luminescens]TDB48087.1 phage tail protein [Photorhabdus luminescens subsp. mexicana]